MHKSTFSSQSGWCPQIYTLAGALTAVGAGAEWVETQTPPSVGEDGDPRVVLTGSPAHLAQLRVEELESQPESGAAPLIQDARVTNSFLERW